QIFATRERAADCVGEGADAKLERRSFRNEVRGVAGNRGLGFSSGAEGRRGRRAGGFDEEGKVVPEKQPFGAGPRHLIVDLADDGAADLERGDEVVGGEAEAV